MSHILSLNVPILGLCLGHQFVAAALGGEVRNVPSMSEYGPTSMFAELIYFFIFSFFFFPFSPH
jgi:GMP synthase-like glutamine amidotransferase